MIIASVNQAPLKYDKLLGSGTTWFRVKSQFQQGTDYRIGGKLLKPLGLYLQIGLRIFPHRVTANVVSVTTRNVRRTIPNVSTRTSQ